MFGNYQTIKKLGSGTFGEVYLRVDLVSKGQVAIKLESIKALVPMLELESNMYVKLQVGNGMGLQNPHGWRVWVATGMGVGMDIPTHEQQNEPKMSQNG